MFKAVPTPPSTAEPKKDADYVFYELTRSICPTSRRVIDGHVFDSRQQGVYAQAVPRARHVRKLDLRRCPGLHEFVEIQQARHHSGGFLV